MKKILNIENYFIKLILILVCGMSYGQVEIRGKVISELSKETLWYGYSIKPNIKEHPKSKPNESGEFIIEYLEPNKEYDIIISAVGYEDQIFKVKTNESITYKTFELKVNCLYSSKKAENDWEKGKPQFLLIGSIAPIGNTKSDNKFEKKYKIEYYDFGCGIPNYECVELYNQKIAELMDKKYGKKWRKKARKDIVGI